MAVLAFHLSELSTLVFFILIFPFCQAIGPGADGHPSVDVYIDDKGNTGEYGDLLRKSLMEVQSFGSMGVSAIDFYSQCKVDPQKAVSMMEDQLDRIEKPLQSLFGAEITAARLDQNRLQEIKGMEAETRPTP